MSGVDAETLRRLAELHTDGKVLSLYLNLDPSVFPTPAARRTEIESLLGEAEGRYLKGVDNLSHADKMAIREDMERVRGFFEGGGFSAKGARALAVFCSGPAGLFEVLKLPRQVQSEVIVDASPFVEPLTGMVSPDGWCVLLINRRTGRILRGTAERLEEVATVRDPVHGQHDQGGWSQARYQRGIEKEVQDHVKRTCEELFELHKRAPVDRLILGTAKELAPEVEAKLHPYLRELVVGRIEIDVERSTPDEVRREAAAVMEEEEQARERAALDRLAQGIGTGTGAVAGLEHVLSALNEKRVEALLIEGGFRAPGVACPVCGWAGASGDVCPVEGSELEARDDVIENAVELALMQAAAVQLIRHHEDLRPLGSIGALCRF